MRKYYTRPCNFYYGNYAKRLISRGKALPIAGNTNIAFDKIEIFQRKKVIKNNIFSIHEIKKVESNLSLELTKD